MNLRLDGNEVRAMDDEEREFLKRFASMPKKEIEALYGSATRAAVEADHAEGFPTTHGDEKGIYRLYPDGHKEYIEEDSVAEEKPHYLTMNKSDAEALLAEAAQEAIAKAHALGLPTTHMDEKGVYRLYPDGHKEYISEGPEGEDPKKTF